MIERVPVQSSNVVSAGYDRATSTLEVEFRTGVYRITDFPEDEWRAFMGAPSVGSYYQQSIRPRYTAALVDPDADTDPEPEVEDEPQVEDEDDGEWCEDCGMDVGLESHYHCPNCGGVCSMMGHLDQERNVYTCERRRVE
jgi:predicted RNA-binding Zn-ribbon protein involved in translation (DUF1610 family)